MTEKSSTPHNFASLDWVVETHFPRETQKLAKKVADNLRGGEIILLSGELGAGKTCFANALGAALGVDEPLVSPSYILLRSYPARKGLTIHHLDFYRLESSRDLETMGVEECVGPDSILLVEWPERCPHAFEEFSLALKFHLTGDQTRRIEGTWGKLPMKREDYSSLK